MKMVKKSKKKSIDTSALADELGADYEAARERAKAAADQQHLLSDRIKSIAKEEGAWSGDRCVITGATYTVGLVVAKPPQEVDWEAFAEAQPKLYAKLLTAQVDEAKVEKCLQDGTLSRKLLGKFIKPKRAPSERVIVERTGHNEAH